MSAALPVLVALRGIPGIGKTVLARAVGREPGWPALEKDDIKEVVYGRTPVADGLSYHLLFRLAQRQVRQGLNVVVDSPLMIAGLYALASRTALERVTTSFREFCTVGTIATNVALVSGTAAYFERGVLSDVCG